MIKEHYNSWIPKVLRVGGITFRNHVFYRYSKEEVPESMRIHEAEHVEQYREDGVIKFLVIYLWEYFRNMGRELKKIKWKSKNIRGTWSKIIRAHHLAYYKISYEVDARKAELIDEFMGISERMKKRKAEFEKREVDE